MSFLPRQHPHNPASATFPSRPQVPSHSHPSPAAHPMPSTAQPSRRSPSAGLPRAHTPSHHLRSRYIHIPAAAHPTPVALALSRHLPPAPSRSNSPRALTPFPCCRLGAGLYSPRHRNPSPPHTPSHTHPHPSRHLLSTPSTPPHLPRTSATTHPHLPRSSAIGRDRNSSKTITSSYRYKVLVASIRSGMELGLWGGLRDIGLSRNDHTRGKSLSKHDHQDDHFC